jgi:hypothetical protein
VSVFLCVVLSCVSVEALRRADPPSKESYQLSNRFTSKNPSTPQGKRGRLRMKESKKERFVSDPAVNFMNRLRESQSEQQCQHNIPSKQHRAMKTNQRKRPESYCALNTQDVNRQCY